MAAENRGPELAAVVISLLAFSFITVSLRCYTMALMLKRFFAEDWLAVITLILYTTYSSFVLLSIHYGLGQHNTAFPISQHSHALLFKYLGQVFYVLISVLVKFIVGLFLLRICSHQRWQLITIYVLLGIIALFNAFYIFIVTMQCIPVNFYYLLLNVLSDFTLALLPVSFVWKSNMERRTKISVVGVLALGSIASLATAARIPYAKQLLHNPGYLYNSTDLAIWSTVEIGLTLSASSLATLKPLFRKPKILATTQRPTTTNGGENTNRKGTSRPRKLSTMSMRLGRRGSKFVEVMDHGSRDTEVWCSEPSEKGGGVELGVIVRKDVDVVSMQLVPGKVREGVERVRQFSFSGPRPQPKIYERSGSEYQSPLAFSEVAFAR